MKETIPEVMLQHERERLRATLYEIQLHTLSDRRKVKFVHKRGGKEGGGEQSKASGSENAIVKCTINRRRQAQQLYLIWRDSRKREWGNYSTLVLETNHPDTTAQKTT